MNPIMCLFRSIVSIVILLGLAGCSNTPSASLTPSATLEEQYQEMKGLSVTFNGEFTRMVEDANNDILELEGNITELIIGGKNVELVSTKVPPLVEKNVLYLDTKDYGKIKLVMNRRGIVVWLKPSQKALFDQ